MNANHTAVVNLIESLNKPQLRSLAWTAVVTGLANRTSTATAASGMRRLVTAMTNATEKELMVSILVTVYSGKLATLREHVQRTRRR